MMFRCKRCGNCCTNMSAFATVSDIKRWKSEGREDILVYVDGLYRIWINPKTKKRIVGQCPFLCKDNNMVFFCSIQETKPYICTSFEPTTRLRALEIGCRGYEE